MTIKITERFYIMNHSLKIGFIGLGLIGGSIAKAIRQYYPDAQIVAFDKSRETLALAASEFLTNTTTTSINEEFLYCDYIFLCAPVAFNTAYLKQLEPYLHPGLILSDVGSVKSSIHEEVEALHLSPYFIGGHPMAGSEKSGFVNAKAILIENAYYVLTPSKEVSQEKIDQYVSFIESLKALPIILDYKEHDQITGTISHLPHIIASTLVNYVKDHDSNAEIMKQLAAGGFKDITRIASSSPTMWQHICLKNKDYLSEILEQYIYSLEDVKRAIDSQAEDALYHLFETSKNYRNSIPDASRGPIKKAFVVYCDIVDETGGIATIATILASNNISLKNIGIVHNREFEEGVLCIEFYDEMSSLKAATLLKKYRYIVYER